MKHHLAAFFACALAACSDDPGPGRDTINDGSDIVDTSDTADSTGDSADTTDSADSADSADTSDTSDTVQPLAVVINELAAAGDPADWIELYNAGPSAVDLTGWLFRDDDPAHAYVFPAGTSIAPGDYLVRERDDTAVTGFDFGLGGTDAALLYDAGDNLVDQTSWLEGESGAGRSWGRFPDASGPFKTLLTPTRGAANVDNPPDSCGNGTIEGFEVCDGDAFGGLDCAVFGWGGGALTCAEDCSAVAQDGCSERAPGLVINEVESDEGDRIELFNGGAAEVDLSGWVVSDEGGSSYTVPIGTTLAAGAYLVFERDVNHTFGLGDADALTLSDGAAAIVDSIGWTSGRAIPSYCRSPNGTGGFRTCDEQTFGNANF